MNSNLNEFLQEGQVLVVNRRRDLVSTFPNALNEERQSFVPTTQVGGGSGLNDNNTMSQRNVHDMFSFLALRAERNNPFVNFQNQALSSQLLLQSMARIRAEEVFNQQLRNPAILSDRALESIPSSALLTPHLFIHPHERTTLSCDGFSFSQLSPYHVNSPLSNQSPSTSSFDFSSNNRNEIDFSHHILRNHRKTDDVTSNKKDPPQEPDYIIAPCSAERMPLEHNYKTAYFVIKNNIRHGDELICSHKQCRNSGIKFKYCSHCKVPVSKRKFAKKHMHEDLKKTTSRHNVEVISACVSPDFEETLKTVAVVEDEKPLLCGGKRKFEEVFDTRKNGEEERMMKKPSSLRESRYVFG